MADNRSHDLEECRLTSRVLITGGAGFIGAGVVRALLERGDAVVVFDSGAAAGFGYLGETGAEIVEAGLLDVAALDRAVVGCDSIVHLAGQTSVPNSVADPVADAAINVDGSIGLLEAARAHGINRFVFASSNAVVAGHPPPTNEEMTPNPVAPYGAAKASVEAYLRAYGAAYGLEGVALRFANAYGPRSAHKTSVVAAFVRAYLSGGPLVIRGDGHQTRDFVYVSDVAAAIVGVSRRACGERRRSGLSDRYRARDKPSRPGRDALRGRRGPRAGRAPAAWPGRRAAQRERHIKGEARPWVRPQGRTA